MLFSSPTQMVLDFINRRTDTSANHSERGAGIWKCTQEPYFWSGFNKSPYYYELRNVQRDSFSVISKNFKILYYYK